MEWSRTREYRKEKCKGKWRQKIKEETREENRIMGRKRRARIDQKTN